MMFKALQFGGTCQLFLFDLFINSKKLWNISFIHQVRLTIHLIASNEQNTVNKILELKTFHTNGCHLCYINAEASNFYLNYTDKCHHTANKILDSNKYKFYILIKHEVANNVSHSVKYKTGHKKGFFLFFFL